MQLIYNIRLSVFMIMLWVCMGALSCKKYLEIPPPLDQITKEQLYTDSATIASNMWGLYSNSFQNFELGVYPQLITGLSSDELTLSTPSGQWAAFLFNTYTPADARVATLWSTRYKVIYQANSIIENLPASKVISESLKRRFLAEAKFMRAFEYINLTGYFGDVPLVLTTDINKTARLSRTSKAIVYDSIIADLKVAEHDLDGATDYTRATTWAAQALLARVYLYKNDWANALAMSTKAMSGSFVLEQNLDNVFLRGSKEAILQVSSKAGGANYTGFTRWGALLSPSSNARLVPVYIFTAGQMSAFEAGDARRAAWVLKKTVNGTEYNCPYKYRLKTSNPTRAEEHILLRLPEQMLIKAEALAEQNDLPEARKYVDTIRQRAGLGKLATSLSKQEILDAIEKERRAELFLEGDRWYYLAHRNKADAVLGALKPSWKPEAKLLPVPQKERIYNINLSQNDGYK